MVLHIDPAFQIPPAAVSLCTARCLGRDVRKWRPFRLYGCVGIIFTVCCEPYLDSEYGDAFVNDSPVRLMDLTMHGHREFIEQEVRMFDQASLLTLVHPRLDTLRHGLTLVLLAVRVKGLSGAMHCPCHHHDVSSVCCC